MTIVSFYTELYQKQHHVLKKSLDKFNLKYDIQKINSRGNWKSNCLYRAQFIVEMMEKHNDSILWLDADAEVLQYPTVLCDISPNVDLAWHDRMGREIMLGTSYFRNNYLVKYLLMDWVSTCDINSQCISQKDFMRVYHSKYVGKFILQILPESYCHIFDKPILESPVIVHNQLSRKTRNMVQSTATPVTPPVTTPVNPPTTPSYNDSIAKIKESKLKITEKVNIPVKNKSLKTVYLPLNQTGWAFDVRCTLLEKHLSSFYNIKKVSGTDVARKGIGLQADLVYWPTYESLESMGSNCNRACATIGGLVLRTLDESIHHFGVAKAIAVPNLSWYLQYLGKNLPKVKFFLIPNGVDTGLFTPGPPINRGNDEFVVGWAGNSRPDRARVKRINELEEVCTRLGIVLLKQTRSYQIEHDKMPDFYRQIDVYLNLSITEGSNNCILEASACGIPVLATEVGNVPEMVNYGALTIKQDLSDLESKLTYIRDLTRQQRQSIGSKLRDEIISNYNSELMAKRYKEMFDYCLSL